MFQPTNESYIHSVVEATIDRHMGETEEEQSLRQGRSYQDDATRGTRNLFASLSHWLLGIGRHLGTDAPDAVARRRQTVSH